MITQLNRISDLAHHLEALTTTNLKKKFNSVSH